MDARERCGHWGVHLSKQDARLVRRWRVESDLSWRGVAATASQTWGLSWGDNQLFGRDLCAAAATQLGEDPDAEPWN